MLPEDVNTYLTERQAIDLAEASVRHHRHILHQVIDFLSARGRECWANVTAADLDAFLVELMDRGLCRTSRDSFAWVLRGFGRWLTERGKVLRNPAEYLRMPQDDEIPLPPAPLSEEQVGTFFNALPLRHVVDHRNRLHLELLYSCALRNAEAVNLDLSDLDMSDRTVLVREGKGGVTRLVPMLKGTLTAASEYLALRNELLRGPDHGALLLNTHGRRLADYWMQGWLRRASRSLGFKVHPHLFRHSIAVHLLRRDADIRHIQQFLGHADLETTKIYLRLVPGHLKEDYDKAMPILLAPAAPKPSPANDSPAAQAV